MRLDDVALAHVPDAEHQTRHPVPVADDGIAREQQRLGALLRPGQLGKHDANHKCLDEHTGDALQGQYEHGLRAFLRHEAVPVADGVLRFQREQKCRREAVDERNARLVLGV